MLKKELINLLDKKYDFSNCEEWDFCGPNYTKKLNQNINKILVNLDLTIDVLEYAIQNKYNVIITHHPILITSEENHINNTNKIIQNLLINNDITHISLHTCFDRYNGGMSYIIAKKISEQIELTINEDNKLHYLTFIELNNFIKLSKLIKILKKNKFIKTLRSITINHDKYIKRICIGAGSCSSMMNDVINKSDCFLTGDIKWHGYLDALNNNLIMIDIGHDVEYIFVNEIINYINEQNSDLLVHNFLRPHQIINFK